MCPYLKCGGLRPFLWTPLVGWLRVWPGPGIGQAQFQAEEAYFVYIYMKIMYIYICTLPSVLCILLNAFVFRLSCWQHFIFYSFFIYQQKTEIVIIYIFLDNLVIISFSKCLWYTPLFDMYVYEYYIMYILDSTVRL